MAWPSTWLVPGLAQRSHETTSGSVPDAGVRVQPGVFGVSLPTGAAGAAVDAVDGAAAARDVGTEAGVTAYAVVAARAVPENGTVESAAATAETPRRSRRPGRDVIGVASLHRATGGRVDAEDRHHAGEGRAVVGRLLERVAVGHVVVLAALVVHRDVGGELALLTEIRALAEPRVGADEQLVGDDGQLGRDGVRRRVPVLDVPPVHERVDRLAGHHVEVVLEVRQVLARGPHQRVPVLV